MRTGRELRYPERWSRVCSVRSVSPPIPYMICRSQSPPGVGSAGQRLEEEREVLERLPVEAEVVQRPQHERGVADPRVAVVPVALAARRLGQRRGARGHDRPGRRVAQALERERAALDVRAATGGRRWSASASQSRQYFSVARELRHRLVLGGRARRPPTTAPATRTRPARASCARSVRAPRMPRRRLLGRGRARGRRSGTVDALVAAVVVGPLAARCGRSRTAGGSWPAPRPGRCSTSRCAAACPAPWCRRARAGSARAARRSGARPDHEQVRTRSASRSACARSSRARSCRARSAAGWGRRCSTGPKRKKPGRAVEQRAEHARRVGPREAQPLDRPVGRDQRADLAVGQERVVGDRRKSRHVHLSVARLRRTGSPLGWCGQSGTRNGTIDLVVGPSGSAEGSRHAAPGPPCRPRVPPEFTADSSPGCFAVIRHAGSPPPGLRVGYRSSPRVA